MPYRYLLPLLLLIGCATSRPLPVAGGYCDPPLPERADPAFRPLPDVEAALTPALLARYPRRNLLTANALGLLPALREQLILDEQARRQPGPAAEVAVLRQRQRILAQVVLVRATIASLAAELDCEGERADQVAGYLDQLDNRRTQRLNAVSISIGAASGIGTTLFDDKPAQYAFGIGGGLLGAGLGLLTLRPAGHAADVAHPRNLLAAVWREEAAPADWPPSVWYLLSQPAFSNAGRTSIAYNTRQRWQTYSNLQKPDSREGRALVALLFGPGGRYEADQLHLRANLLNEMQSAVRLLDQEVQALLLVLE